MAEAIVSDIKGDLPAAALVISAYISPTTLETGKVSPEVNSALILTGSGSLLGVASGADETVAGVAVGIQVTSACFGGTTNDQG
jgi:hypothetical protein